MKNDAKEKSDKPKPVVITVSTADIKKRKSGLTLGELHRPSTMKLQLN